jgi:hypothetical protein
MPPSVNKFAPQAIALIVALYWSWPALKTFVSPAGPPKVEAKGPAETQDFTAALLSPKFESISSRNPFLALGARPAAGGGSVKVGKKGSAGKTAGDIRESGLVLNATCIVGKQRMAIINGRVYKEKEAIQRSGDESASCVVIDIHPHKVLLSYQGETLQLGYLNAAVKTVAGSDVQKPPK